MRKLRTHITRMAAPVLRRLMSAALRQPRVKRAARIVLSHIPGLQSRLRALLYSNAWAMQSGATPPEPVVGSEAPARTARIFRELKQAQQKQAQQARKDRCE